LWNATHSAVAISTALWSRQGPRCSMHSALYEAFTLSASVVERVALGTDGGSDSGFFETRPVDDGKILHLAVGVMDELAQVLASAGPDPHL
jgi:hypothetical protein